MTSRKDGSQHPADILQKLAKIYITETRDSIDSNDAISKPLKLSAWLAMKVDDYEFFEQYGTEEQFQFHMSFEGIDTVTRISEALANFKAVIDRVESGGELTARDVPTLEKADKAFNFIIYAATEAAKDNHENRDGIETLVGNAIDDDDYDKALTKAINSELQLRQKTLTQLQEIQSGIQQSAKALKTQGKGRKKE